MMLVSQLVRDDAARDLAMEESKHAVNNILSIELGIKKNTLSKEVKLGYRESTVSIHKFSMPN